MPTTWNGMTRVLVEGIPIWKNGTGEIFYYEHEPAGQPIKIGTLAGGFSGDWIEACAEGLAAYRQNLKVRARAGAGPARKN